MANCSVSAHGVVGHGRTRRSATLQTTRSNPMPKTKSKTKTRVRCTGLLDCPFCGGKARLKTTANRLWWIVECQACGARSCDCTSGTIALRLWTERQSNEKAQRRDEPSQTTNNNKT